MSSWEPLGTWVRVAAAGGIFGEGGSIERDAVHKECLQS